MEDILTSNVFAFFKYATREVFFKGYLNELGFSISDQEAKEAEFVFWPRFEENTEPDLVVIVGDYYLLIEAKYFSEFGGGTEKTKAQLLRELRCGKLEAKNYGKDFKLIAITADYYFKKEKFSIIPRTFISHLKWTNWQSVALFLTKLLETKKNIRSHERDFASDLCNLLDKKNLRQFQNFDLLCHKGFYLKEYPSVFFEAKTAKFRGAFIGFTNSLLFEEKIFPERTTIFLTSKREIFTLLSQLGKLRYADRLIFFRGG
jgi:hypothetical protein